MNGAADRGAALPRPEVLALIPARGGSKAIPRKNLLVLAGKPLLAYSIEQALASKHITRTVVSTDDEETAAVARAFGAEVPFMRPPELAQDLSTDLDVFRHALAALREREGYRCDLVAHLRPTGPLRRVAVIDEAIGQMLRSPDADSMRSVSRADQTPYKMWRIAGGMLQPVLQLAGIAEPYSMPRQSLPEIYWQNGYLDLVRPEVILERHLMAGERILPFVIEDPIVELDYPDTLPTLEAALMALQRGEWPPGRTAGPKHSV
jgi:CMP-N,N'-diacetyllegionaminic acid synthase